MQQKKLIHLFKRVAPIFFIGSFSFLINYHYGFIGLMPMDNTVLYNGGYRVLNGYVPFTDYWLVTGPLLDYLNALFFSILGVSWKTFIIHSSLINLLFGLASYFLFIQLELSKKFSIFYSILMSVLFYPVVGTPFVDHHSTFFLIIAFYIFIFSVYKKNYFSLIFIPLFFCLSFLSKQTPAAYGLLTILPLISLLCFLDKKNIKKILINLLFGSAISLFLLVIFIFFTNIDISNFVEQYIFFAGSIGEYRLSNYDLNILDILNKFKFIFFYIFILIIITIYLSYKKKINGNNLLVLIASLAISLILIFHQFLTLNQNFIFFIIPFLCGITHIYYLKILKKKYLLIVLISVCIFSVSKYHLRFNEDRKFNELEGVDLSKAIDAKVLSNEFKGLQWITYRYPDDPNRELNNLKQIIKILKNDSSKRMLITDYQFLSPTLNTYDFSPNQWHHPTVSFPLNDQKYFKKYKNFFIKNLKNNNIDFIYETTENDKSITELVINKDCLKKVRASEMLLKIELLKNCKDLN